MDNAMSYSLMKAGYDESGFNSWILNFPTQWRKYTSSREVPYREGLRHFCKLYAGYQLYRKKIEAAIAEKKSDIDQIYYLCEVGDGNFDDLILKNTPSQDLYIQQGITSDELQRTLFEKMNSCLVEKNKIVELSEELANVNGKPTSVKLRKWLHLDLKVRMQIKNDPVNALPFFLDSLYDTAVEYQSLEDIFEKLKQKNVELQEQRAKECDELLCVKTQLDKVKQEADHFWKEKEAYWRELKANDCSALKHQLAVERTKVSELTNKYQDLLKEKEKLLTRLSEVAGSKLTSNNPAITDLSDENRPLKLAEKFSQLYDDDWTDSLEEITSFEVDEKAAISFLQRLVMTAFHLCSRSQTILVNAEGCWNLRWCDIVKLEVLHEIQLPDAAKLDVDRAVKRSSHGVQKDLIFRTQKRFRYILADMLRVTTNEKAYCQMAPVDRQSEQLESDKKESKDEQKKHKVNRDFNIPAEHNVLKPKFKRSFSTGCSVVDCNNTYSKGVIPGKEKQTARSRHDKYRNRLADSARGDFLRPRYEDYVREGFLLDKDSIEKLYLEPSHVIERFPKTTQFADHCIELCWLMQSTQPPVHLSVDIPESRELKHETFKAYTKSGHIIDYVVWPAMYLHKEGPLLSKGVAQPL
ncbi:uncharacterized protein LOC134240489 isoform X2 [Saccostrea cucullata]|uniref:uncharacterized protein LOC134240489 isoform X2 n=1 Tax=Saccostrea cuccullata TaxID=36930 RepID=UPI002ED0C4CF